MHTWSVIAVPARRPKSDSMRTRSSEGETKVGLILRTTGLRALTPPRVVPASIAVLFRFDVLIPLQQEIVAVVDDFEFDVLDEGHRREA